MTSWRPIRRALQPTCRLEITGATARFVVGEEHSRAVFRVRGSEGAAGAYPRYPLQNVRTNAFLRWLRESPLGIVGLFVFVVCVFFVPAAHQINHRDDHDHGLAGFTPHGLGEHHHHDANGNDVPDAPKPAHGHGSIEHFGAAFSFAHPVIVPPCAAFAFVEIVRPLESAHVDRTFNIAQPRGPPVPASST